MMRAVDNHEAQQISLFNHTDAGVIRNRQPVSRPIGRVTEIIAQETALEDMPLFMPLLAQLSQDERWFAWISPPANLPKQLLKEAGIDLKKVILLYPDEEISERQMARKVLEAGTCHAVINWHGSLSEHEVKQLELSSQKGGSQCILIRKRYPN